MVNARDVIADPQMRVLYEREATRKGKRAFQTLEKGAITCNGEAVLSIMVIPVKRAFGVFAISKHLPDFCSRWISGFIKQALMILDDLIHKFRLKENRGTYLIQIGIYQIRYQYLFVDYPKIGR